MLRFIRFLVPRAGVSEDAFNSYRRDILGPLIAGHQADLHLIRYVQTHRWRGSPETELAFQALRPGAGNFFAGLDEFWWRDEATGLKVITQEDRVVAETLRLDDRWVDLQSSVSWLAFDYPQVATTSARVIAAPRSGILKLTFAISPSLNLSEENARRYWLAEHGPLIRSLAPARGALAYTQVHRQRDRTEPPLVSGGRASEIPFMGHAEAWFPDNNIPRGTDGEAAAMAAAEDERKFIDWSRSCVLIGKELVFVDRNWL